MSTHKNLKKASQNVAEFTEGLTVLKAMMVVGTISLGIIAFVMLTDLMIKISDVEHTS